MLTNVELASNSLALEVKRRAATKWLPQWGVTQALMDQHSLWIALRLSFFEQGFDFWGRFS